MRFDLKNKIVAFIKKLTSSAMDYKLSSLFAFLFTIAVVTAIYKEYPYKSIEDIYLHNIAISSMIGFLLSLIAIYSPKPRLFSVVAVVATATYFIFLPTDRTFDSIVYTRHSITVMALMLLLFYTPFYSYDRDNHRVFRWVLNIIESSIIALVFSVILYLSLMGAITSIDKLFELDLGYKHYSYLASIVFGLFTTHYFLSLLDKKPAVSVVIEYNKINHFFSKYMLTSIVAIYSSILISYIVKIIYLGQLPSGVVVWLSLVFTFFAFVSYLFWTPFKNRYKKLLIYVAIIQLPLLFIAISMRLIQYGWSINRYMIVLVAMMLLVALIYIAISRRYRYEYIFAFFTIVLLLSQYGYGINSYNISGASQLERLQMLLSSEQNLSESSDQKIKCDISSAIDELYSYGDIERLNIALPNVYDKYSSSDNYISGFAPFATKELGFEYLNSWVCSKNIKSEHTSHDVYYISRNNQNGVIVVDGYEYLYKSIRLDRGDIDESFRIDKIDNRFMLTVGIANRDIMSRFDIDDFIKSLVPYNAGTNIINHDGDKMTLILSDDKIELELLVNSLNYDSKKDVIQLTMADILVRFK